MDKKCQISVENRPKAEYHRKQMEMFEAAAEQFPDF